MKRSLIFCLCICSILMLLTSCDPIYPVGDLKIKGETNISVGETSELLILYPDIGGSIVVAWCDKTIEIVSGNDTIEVSRISDSDTFSVTGLKSGKAVIKVSATTILTDDAKSSGNYKEKIYSNEIGIEVNE